MPTARTLHGSHVNGLRRGTEPRRGYLPPLQLFSPPLLDDEDGFVMGRFHGKPCEILPVHLVEPGILRCPGHLHCRSGVIEIAMVAQTGSHGDAGAVERSAGMSPLVRDVEGVARATPLAGKAPRSP